MSEQRQFQSQIVSENYIPGQYNDTTFTKIFVGGLAWETQRDAMRRYFEQFGEILEAVVIADKNTGRSKGYGFVTFKEPEAAMRACQNPSPVIDGRRANCNLAFLGARKNRPSTSQHGPGRFRPSSAYHGPSSSTYIPQPARQYSFPFPSYGYPSFSHDTLYTLQSYYNSYGGQHISPYYATGASSGSQGIFPGFYPFYPQYAQGSQAHGLGVQYPQMFQYPYLPPQFNSTGILSLPSSPTMSSPSAGVITSTTATSTTNVPSTMVTTITTIRTSTSTSTTTTAGATRITGQDASDPTSEASAEKSSSS